MGLVFHNLALERLHSADDYTASQVEALAAALDAHGTLRLTPLSTGLYPASSAVDPDAAGYRHVWVRDNVYVAFALWRSGRPEPAVAVARGLLAFYGKHGHRFEIAAVAAGFDARDVMTRPHGRFDGLTLEEIPGRWAHAQNDALGYCLWLAATLAARRVFVPTVDEVEALRAIVGYLEAIRFWNDEDGGLWEETRRISASSIGAVDAGLRAWRELLRAAQLRDIRLSGVTILDARALETTAAALIDEAGRALLAILPAECAQPSPRQNRRYDAALLFLVHPLGVVHGALAGRILDDVQGHLQGAVGIRRYLRDSYWAPDASLEDVGREAQWCMFDPMLSALYGERVKTGGGDADRAAQVAYFNRALAQVTEDWACPELYYERDGMFVPNPHTPLLWTQANLRLALEVLRETAG